MIQKTMYYGLQGLTIAGDNFKRDDSPRHWSGKATGGSYKSNRGETMIEVKEVNASGKKQTRWLNLSTFTGSIGQYKFERGKRIDSEKTVAETIPAKDHW